jgi:hypothetical protein
MHPCNHATMHSCNHAPMHSRIHALTHPCTHTSMHVHSSAGVIDGIGMSIRYAGVMLTNSVVSTKSWQPQICQWLDDWSKWLK